MALPLKPSQSTTVSLVFLVLLSTLVLSNAAFLHRRPLQSDKDSADTAALSNKEIGLPEENVLGDGDTRLSLPADNDMDGPVLTIPQFVDRAISSAFSSVDRMSSGLLSGLAGPNVEFGRSKDGKRLIARLHLPPVDNTDGKHPVSPKISVAVLGRSHLRVKLDMRGDSFQSFSEHTYALPARVSSDDVTVTPQEDGTVHVSLRIVKDADEVPSVDRSEGGTDTENKNSFLDRRLKNPLFPMLIHRDSLNDPGFEEEVVEELPRAEDVDHCRSRYPNEKILRKKCMCDVTPAKLGKAVCYGSLISKAVSVARRMGMHTFATSAKHHAIECADGHVDAVECLEKIASQLLQSLYKQDSSDKPGGRLEDRVRTAIESEDDGPSNFQPSYGALFFSLVMIALLVGVFAVSVMMCTVRRFRGNSQSNRILSELSSVLTQTRKPASVGDTTPERQASRLGPFQGTSKPSNSRAMHKLGPKSGTSESKIA